MRSKEPNRNIEPKQTLYFVAVNQTSHSSGSSIRQARQSS